MSRHVLPRGGFLLRSTLKTWSPLRLFEIACALGGAVFQYALARSADYVWSWSLWPTGFGDL